jgi:hypothetical protein
MSEPYPATIADLNPKEPAASSIVCMIEPIAEEREATVLICSILG